MGLHDYSDEPAQVKSDNISHHTEDVKKLESVLHLVQRFLSLEKDEPSEIEIEFHKFKKLIEEDYLEHTLKDEFTKEAQTYQEFLSIIDKLEEIVNYHFLANKTVIGVGGGFSAGKSRFINSLIGYDFLPVDTTPTTSIPTYLTKGKEKKIEVRTMSDIIVRLDEYDFKSITHKITNESGFSLAGLINSSVVFTDYVQYENIVLLDTPGYTKSDYYKKTDKTDEFIAQKQLEKTDALFWLIDIENGTIKQDDIEFIKRMKYDKPKYFILNKADKKTEYDIHQILDQVHNTLLSKQINYEGIIAYSSYKKKTYAHKGKTISEYLEKMDKLSTRDYKELFERLDKIFKDYESYYEEKEKNEKKQLSILNKVSSYIDDDLMGTLDELTKKSKKMIPHYQQISRDMKTLQEKILSQFDVIFKKIQGDNFVSFRSGIGNNTISPNWNKFLWGKEEAKHATPSHNDFPENQVFNPRVYNMNKTYDKSNQNYSLGGIGPAGGIIFYIDQGVSARVGKFFEVSQKEFGLKQLATDMQDANTDFYTSAKIYRGKYNTSKLVEKNIYLSNFVYLYKSGEYNDWFIPSIEELQLVYNFINENNSSLNQNSVSNFLINLRSKCCWSSTNGSRYAIIRQTQTFAGRDFKYLDMRNGNISEKKPTEKNSLIVIRQFDL